MEPTQVWWVEPALKQEWQVEPVPVHSVVRQEWWEWQVEPVQVRLAYLRTPAEAVSVLEQVVQVQVRLAYLRTPAAVVSVLEQEVPMAEWQVVQVEAHSVVQQEWWVVPVQVRLAYLRTPAAAVSVLEQEVPMAEALSMEVLACCSVLLPQLNYLNL